MAVILAQKIELTAQDGRLIRAVLRQLVQREEGEPTWEDAGDLRINEDGTSVVLPVPGDILEGKEEEETTDNATRT